MALRSDALILGTSGSHHIEEGGVGMHLCFKLFTAAGFEWGGDWTTRKDYQHFEIVE